MKYTVPVSSKGQFTIPSRLRKVLRIKTGTLLQVSLDKKTIHLNLDQNAELQDFFGSIHENSSLSTKEIVHKGVKQALKQKFSKYQGSA